MNWIPMKMRFPGKCIECGETVNAGEAGLWMKGTGVKHERCGAAAESGDVRAGGGQQGAELRCLVCGKPAGCPACEFSDACDTAAVSQLCMCYDCMDDKDTYALYRAAASRKFPGLEPEEAGRAPGGQWGGEPDAKPRGAGAAGGRKEAAPGLGQDGNNAGGARSRPAGRQDRLVQGQLMEVDIAGSGGQEGGGPGKKRRGSASGQQRL